MNKTLTLTVLACIALAACVPPNLAEVTEGTAGTLVLSFATVLTVKTIEPTLDMTVVSYDVYGDGPGDAAFELLDVAETVVEQPGLVPGLWTVTAYGKNVDGVTVGMGQVEVTVESGEVAIVEIAVTPLTGNGTLSVNVTWPSGVLGSPTTTASLSPAGGAPETLVFSVDETSAAYSGLWMNGYYTLAFTLMDAGQPVWGMVEAARIVAGETSHKSYDLVRDVNRGGLTITPDMQSPIEITFSGTAETLDLGGSMTVTAATSEPVDSYQWYLQGVLIGGATLAEVTVGEGLGVGIYRLDLMVTKDSTLSSDAIVFEVVDSNVRSLVDSAGNVGLFPSVGVDGSTVYVSYGDWDSYDVKFASSPDGGVTWNTQTLDATGNAGSDSSLVVDPAGIFVAYPEHISGDLKLKSSVDGGLTWSSEIIESVVGVKPDMLSDGTTLRVSYLGADGALLFASRPVSGGAWQNSMIQNGNYGANDMAIAGSTIYISCYSWTTYSLYCARSQDGGATWSLLTVDSSGQVSGYTAIATDGGNVYIGYYRYGRFYLAASSDGGDTWSISIADNTVTSGQYISMEMRGSSLIASYFTSAGLKFASSSDDGATWTIATVDGAGSGSGGTSLAVDGGKVHLAYRNETDQELRFAKSTDGGVTW